MSEQPLEVVKETSPQKASALAVMAARANVEPAKLLSTLKATVFKGASDDELLALVVVANQYELNPFLREIYAFPNGKGGIVPMVPVDGWSRIVNREPSFDGMEPFKFEEGENGKPHSCTCTMYQKGRTHPVSVTEYYSECHRNTPPWNTMPRRMLRHKAFMQAARLAFGLSGIFDEDEARDIARNGNVSAPKPLEDVRFGPAIPDPEPEEKPKRKRRTKAEIAEDQAKAVTKPAEPEPVVAVDPGVPEGDQSVTVEPTPLVTLRTILLNSEISETALRKYLIANMHIEPSDTFEKLSDEKINQIIESLDSIREELE